MEKLNITRNTRFWGLKTLNFGASKPKVTGGPRPPWTTPDKIYTFFFGDQREVWRDPLFLGLSQLFLWTK